MFAVLKSSGNLPLTDPAQCRIMSDWQKALTTLEEKSEIELIIKEWFLLKSKSFFLFSFLMIEVTK